MENTLPLGKLPVELLARILAQAPAQDPRIIQGPGIGLDCAVVDAGPTLFVLKSDPITFATEEIGWYAVQVNCNDIATTGATPRWFLITQLLPEGKTTPELVERISQQAYQACRQLGISVIGGHAEITHGLDHPILVGTLIGEVAREQLISPQGIQPGDHVLLTKGIPIEGTAILAREFPDRLAGTLTSPEIEQARDYLFEPGISVLRDAQIATQAGKVTGMHDPTEGGLTTALWELAEASHCSLTTDLAAVPIPPLAKRVCDRFGLDPYATIASGALLLTTPQAEVAKICQAFRAQNIPCADIATLETGPVSVWKTAPAGREALPRPSRDEIARLFEQTGQ